MKIKTRRYYTYYLALIGGFIVSILPLRVGLFLAGLAGKLIYTFFKKTRKESIKNLKLSFPEKSDEEIDRIAKEVFSNLCKNGVEWLNIYKLNSKNISTWVSSEDRHKVDTALSKGKGVIMLASHFGNWELISAFFTLRGYLGTVIAKRIYFDRYDKFINRLRAHVGVSVVYRDDSPKKILKVLRRNEMLGILADQDVDSVDGVFVNFFERPAYTPKAPIGIALASRAPVLPCFMVREKKGHRLIIEDPLEIEEKENRDETIKYNTQKWSNIIESYIRKYPEQWVWIHRRWKTKEGSKC